MRLKCGHAPLLFEGATLLGKSLYLLKLGRTRRVRWRGQIVWRKRRHFYAPLIVSVGNALSRFFHCGVYGLSHGAWLYWEETLSPLCGDGQTRRQGQNLLSLPMPGVPLREVLHDENALAFCAALRELQRLHNTKMRFPVGKVDFWSHGDAHAGNVFFDAATDRAQWFDFESIHDLRRSPANRHAADLQTFLFSTAVYLAENQWPQIVRLAREIYADELIWREIYDDLLEFENWPNLVHLGHAHLNRHAHARLLKLLKTACQQDLGHREAFH